MARLLGLLAAGETRDQILVGYPYLEAEDIDEAYSMPPCLPRMRRSN